MTNFRVPRWFTEGMAVHEETAVSPEWGDRLDPHVIMAIKDKKLLPVAELDRGFMHPTYPAQVVVSYFQAGKICDLHQREWGWDKAAGHDARFRRRRDNAGSDRKELGIKPDEFDKRFMADLEAETKKTVDGFDEWRKGLKKARLKLQEPDDYDAITRRPRHSRHLSRLRGSGQRLRVAGRSLPRQGRQDRGHRRTGALRQGRRAQP